MDEVRLIYPTMPIEMQGKPLRKFHAYFNSTLISWNCWRYRGTLPNRRCWGETTNTPVMDFKRILKLKKKTNEYQIVNVIFVLRAFSSLLFNGENTGPFPARLDPMIGRLITC